MKWRRKFRRLFFPFARASSSWSNRSNLEFKLGVFGNLLRRIEGESPVLHEGSLLIHQVSDPPFTWYGSPTRSRWGGGADNHLAHHTAVSAHPMAERRLPSSSLSILGVYRDNSSPLLMVCLATTLGTPASHALNTDVLSSRGD